MPRTPRQAASRGTRAVTWLDLAILVSVCACAAFGFWKGIVRALIGIAGLLGGILLAGRLYERVAAALWPSGSSWSYVAAYALVFVAVLVIAAVVAAVLSRVIHMTALGIVDRVIGLVAGGGVAGIAWAGLLSVLLPLVPAADALVAASPLARLLLAWLPAIVS